MSNWLNEQKPESGTMSKVPEIKKDPMYILLREGKIKEFNEMKKQGKTCDLTNADFRSLELQGLDADGLDFSGSYFRLADMRGVDFSKANLRGASIHEAKISGTYFPSELSSDELTMSLIRGTRLRYGC